MSVPEGFKAASPEVDHQLGDSAKNVWAEISRWANGQGITAAMSGFIMAAEKSQPFDPFRSPVPDPFTEHTPPLDPVRPPAPRLVPIPPGEKEEET
jgi:hypothetical protein